MNLTFFENPFRRFVSISLGIHLFIFLVLLFSPNFKRHLPTKSEVKWIKLSRGDGGTNIKANAKNLDHLPQSSLRDQKKAQADQTKAVEKTSTPSVKNEVGKKVTVTDSNKTADTNGGIKLNTQKPVVKDTTDTTMENALKRVAALQEQRKIEIGAAQAHKGDTGQSLTGGDEGTEGSAELVSYYNQVSQKISKEWFVIKSEYVGNLVTRVLVKIDVNGNLIEANIHESSGDGSFDESAMRAIKKSVPFTIPPLSIRSNLSTDGFLFNFNPKSVTGSAL